MPLAVPFTTKQLKAALALHLAMDRRSPDGNLHDPAISQLRERFPKFSDEATLLKVVVVNTLYSTRVFDHKRMAHHVKATLDKTNRQTDGPELVELLARIPGRHRKFLSFSSKFAHSFLEAERFPILDVYAEKALKFHLGRENTVPSRGHRYIAFAKNFERLRSLSRVKCTTRELDRYLWISGVYRSWKRDRKRPISKDFQKLFEHPTRREAADLACLPLGN